MKYQNPNFDREEYRRRRENTVVVLDEEGKPQRDEDGAKITKPQPLRGQGDKIVPRIIGSESSTVSFGNDGTMVIKNRAYRRQRISLWPKSSALRKKKDRKK